MLKAHLFFLSLVLVSSTSSAKDVSIAVASNFAAPMKLLSQQFDRSHQYQTRLSFASSGKLYAQIRHGAPFDLFFSADQAIPSKLLQEKLALPDSQFTYALGALALLSSNPKIKANQESLKKNQFNKLAIANPRLAPYGFAAQQVLHQLGQTKTLQKKIVKGENIAQVFQFVTSGNADFGFIARSQIAQYKMQSNYTVWPVPSELHDPIRQDAVLLTRAANNRAAHAFLTYMKSQSAREIIRQFDYDLPEQGVSITNTQYEYKQTSNKN